MKKIIPYFTKIYRVVLYISKDNKFCVAYSANNIFSKERKNENLSEMQKMHFIDIDSANLYLAQKIYPNIDTLNGMVTNATITSDKQEDAELLVGNISRGGSGEQYYFAGKENLKDSYFSFYMHSEQNIRRQILNKHKSLKQR